MPVEIVDSDGGLGNLVTACGDVTEEGYLQVMRIHLLDDPERFAKYRYTLADYTELGEFSVSAGAIGSVSRMCVEAAAGNPNAVVALIVTEDYMFGLARMWEQLSDQTGWEIEVFRTIERAKDWIRDRVRARWNITDLTFCAD